MSLAGEIVDKLRGTAALTALVPSARITQERRPQAGDWPAIVVEFTDAEHEQDMGGSAGVRDVYVSVTVWARKIGERDSVAEQIRLALHGYSGPLTTLRTQGILIDDDTAFFEPDRAGGENGWYRQAYRFRVMSAEAIPA